MNMLLDHLNCKQIFGVYMLARYITNVNIISPASILRDIGKQYRPRSDVKNAASDQGLHCFAYRSFH